jgi:hypothetical protein
MAFGREGALALALILPLAGPAPAAEPLRRATVWDLKLGEAIAEQPAHEEFRAFACGSNGGPPHQKLAGWGDFLRCAPEPGGLREVYFEYDDELEYIARARDIESEVTRWAGTTESAFPVIASALFDASGRLAGIRLVTDARPDHRNDIIEASLRKREDAYLFGAVMAARLGIDAATDCTSLPPAEGESAVGPRFIKQRCEKSDPANHRRLALSASLYRKPGQSGINPRAPAELTKGQFESAARVEILWAP